MKYVIGALQWKLPWARLPFYPALDPPLSRSRPPTKMTTKCHRSRLNAYHVGASATSLITFTVQCRSKTRWSTCGAYDLTRSMCFGDTDQRRPSLPLGWAADCSKLFITEAVSAAQSSHSRFSFLLHVISECSQRSTTSDVLRAKPDVTFSCTCITPPVWGFSARHAV